MNRFWEDIIEPILSMSNIKNIVEIESQEGINTKKALEYAKRNNGKLYTINPAPVSSVKEWVETYRNYFVFLNDLSLNTLPLIEDYNAILIYGERNWYTVYNELQIIERTFEGKNNFPLVFLHNIGQPYGPRNLYYTPENTLAIRQPYKKIGLNSEELKIQESGFNHHLDNDLYGDTSQNDSVLIAIENFLQKTNHSIIYYNIKAFNGLAVMVPKNGYTQVHEFLNVSFSMYNNIIQKLELERINKHIEFGKQIRELEKQKKMEGSNNSLKTEGLVASINLLKETHKIEGEKLINEYRSYTEREIEETLEQLKKKDYVINKSQQSRQGRSSVSEKVFSYKYSLDETKLRLEQAERAANIHLSSIRYRLGDLILSALKPSKNTLLFPINLIKLIMYAYKKNKGIISNNDIRGSSFYNTSEVAATNYSLKKEYFESVKDYPDCIDIIIPVYNALEELKACVDSILLKTTFPFRIILVNDCSTDEKVKEYLNELSSNNKIIVLHNKVNSGFIVSVNRGIEYSKNDVVILNSDTRVTKDWLSSLVIAAYSNPDIATVTPLSNAAGPFSVPNFNQDNELPDGYNEDDMAMLITRLTNHDYPEVPTGNGFCMYIKKHVIEEIGVFDTAFGRGYCEENDFCMRARAYGFRNIIDDSTFIYHERSASFGKKKLNLIKKNRKLLDDRYPEYKRLVNQFIKKNPLKQLQSKLMLDLTYNPIKIKKKKSNLLFVLHNGGGGTPLTNLDLTRQLTDEFTCYILVSNRDKFDLYELDVETKNLELRWSYGFLSRIELEDFTREDYKILLTNIISKYHIKLIHIRHLLGHTLDLPYIAQGLNVPTVLSFHDFYFICPTIQLLDNKKRYCGGVCTESKGECNFPKNWFPKMPDLKHNWVYVWREKIEEMLNQVDVFITTSNYSKEKYCHIYPSLKKKTFKVIEHGRDFTSFNDVSEEPKPGGKIKIVSFGGVNDSKGKELIIELIKLDRRKYNRIEFHTLGSVMYPLQDYTHFHGSYDREELGRLLAKIKPNFSAIFSIWPETFCHTLTESWANQLPPFVSNIGTLRDRVLENNGGWLVDYIHVDKVYEKIIKVSDDIEEYRRMKNSISRISFKSTLEMSANYREIYKTLIGKGFGRS